MERKTILIIEDDPDDVDLTLRAFKRNNISNDVVVARDGAEGIDYLFGTSTYEGRDTTILPVFVLLDLKLPRMDARSVPTNREDDRQIFFVVILPVDRERMWERLPSGGKQLLQKPVDFNSFRASITGTTG